MLSARPVYVFDCCDSDCILDVGVACRVDAIEVEIATIGLTTTVGGGVVDDYDSVVGVVLSEDGVEVGLNAEVSVVIVAWHNHAHWQFGTDF